MAQEKFPSPPGQADQIKERPQSTHAPVARRERVPAHTKSVVQDGDFQIQTPAAGSVPGHPVVSMGVQTPDFPALAGFYANAPLGAHPDNGQTVVKPIPAVAPKKA